MIDLRHGDCLELMKDIPDGSIDLILCDLPYGITSCDWDTVIPFEKLWPEYERITKSNGVIVLFGTEPFSSKCRMSNLKLYKYDWIWKKNTSSLFVHAKNRPLRIFENIMVFSKGVVNHKSLSGNRRMPYNPQGLKDCYMVENATKKFKNIYHRNPGAKETITRKKTNYPVDILDFKNSNKKFNPTQKPVPLLEYLIKTYTNPGELVLDNCMGSGSTGIACLNTGRDFIGIEKDDHFFEVAKKRIEDHKKELKETVTTEGYADSETLQPAT